MARMKWERVVMVVSMLAFRRGIPGECIFRMNDVVFNSEIVEWQRSVT